MTIEIKKLTEEEIKKLDVASWPIWEKEVSRFDWHYDETEECYVLEGEVIVEMEDGRKVEFGKGDFVTFSKGVSCIWDIRQSVKKRYQFK